MGNLVERGVGGEGREERGWNDGNGGWRRWRWWCGDLRRRPEAAAMAAAVGRLH